MGEKTIIGHIDCPVCGHDMPVKEDKNEHAYGHCAHRCNAQVFTRNEHRNSLLRQRMRPVTVTGTATVTEPPTAPRPVEVPVFLPPVPAPAPKPTAPKAPTPEPAPKPARERANWFNPLMAGG